MPTATERVESGAAKNRSWRLLNTGIGSGAWNMGVDHALMETMQMGNAPILRFYTWERPTVSLGYFQKFDEEIDLVGLQQLEGDWVQRPTGGRAVLHDDELTYSVIIREEDLPGSVIETYRVLSRALVAGLHHLGIPAKVAHDGRQMESSGSAACFDAPSWYEVLADGRKLIGSAQVRRAGVILQHGSIPITFDVQRLLGCLRFKTPQLRERTAGILQQKAGCLSDFLLARPALADIMQSCIRGFEEVFDISLQESQLKTAESQRADQLTMTKYQQGVLT